MEMKKIMKITLVAAFITIAGYGVYTSQKSNNISELALANVEALAAGEGSSSECGTYCKSDDRYTCFIYFSTK